VAEAALQRVERSLFVRTLFGRRQLGKLVEQVAALMRDVYFDPGQVIYTQGEASQYIYLIVSGQVVLDGPGLSPWTFGAQDGIGFQDAMQDSVHARTARATTDVHALMFSVEDWFDVLEGHPELSRGAAMGNSRSVATMVDELGLEAAFPGADPVEVFADLGRAPGLVERMLLLTDTAMLSRAGIQAVAVLARLARPVLAQAGSVVFREGEPKAGIVFVGSGELTLRREAGGGPGRFGPGSAVGSLGALTRDVHEATLVAATDALALEVPTDDFFDAMEDHFDLAKAVFAFGAKERGRLMELLKQKKLSS
jgi:CRP-like cAMP-binding protein